MFLQRRKGDATETLARVALPGDVLLTLKITGDGAAYSFLYRLADQPWSVLRANEDGTILSTDVAGGFVGTMLGPFAYVER